MGYLVKVEHTAFSYLKTGAFRPNAGFVMCRIQKRATMSGHRAHYLSRMKIFGFAFFIWEDKYKIIRTNGRPGKKVYGLPFFPFDGCPAGTYPASGENRESENSMLRGGSL